MAIPPNQADYRNYLPYFFKARKPENNAPPHGDPEILFWNLPVLNPNQEDFMLTMTKVKPFSLHTVERSSLARMDYFKKVPLDGMRQIRETMEEKKFGKHETIFLEDDLADFIWFVKEGHVKEVSHTRNGRSRTISLVGAGGMFGVSAFVGGNYGFHSIAETDAMVFSFPVRNFQSLMDKCPGMGMAVLYYVSKILRRSKDGMRFSQESAEDRVLHVLSEMVGEFGNVIPLTRKEISEMAGVAVETCIRIFTQLKLEGWMTTIHGKIFIKDLNRFRGRVEGLEA
jgi:CRP-like cAMP-binding protein